MEIPDYSTQEGREQFDRMSGADKNEIVDAQHYEARAANDRLDAGDYKIQNEELLKIELLLLEAKDKKEKTDEIKIALLRETLNRQPGDDLNIAERILNGTPDDMRDYYRAYLSYALNLIMSGQQQSVHFPENVGIECLDSLSASLNKPINNLTHRGSNLHKGIVLGDMENPQGEKLTVVLFAADGNGEIILGAYPKVTIAA